MKRYLPYAAFCAGLAFDILFYRKAPGISFAVFIVFCLILGFWLLNRQQIRPSRNSFILLFLILFFSTMTFLRSDPFTTFMNHVLALFFVAVLGITFAGGMWTLFNLQDYLLNFFQLIGSLFVHPKEPTESVDSRQLSGEKAEKKALSLSILRGILLAIPVLVVFTILLSSADMIFAQNLDKLFGNLQFTNIKEYLFRGIRLFLIAYMFAGLISYAAFRSKQEKVCGNENPSRKTFLGFTESTIILGSVLLLFGIFIVIQFRYLFFGESNITFAGFTYSEYARRGFGELVAVAVLSLLLMQGLSLAVKPESKQQRVFNGLLVGLVCAVLIMLVSAYQRLLLYETAYGFSQLRTYAHIFMIWLGILITAVLIFEIRKQPQLFANLVLVVLVGFTVSLNFINVDGFIVRQNIKRAAEGEQLDVSYLASLSADGVPALVKTYASDEISPTLKEEVGAALVCYSSLNDDEDTHWQSFNFSNWRAERALQFIQEELKSYTILENNGLTTIISPSGTGFSCYDTIWMD